MNRIYEYQGSGASQPLSQLEMLMEVVHKMEEDIKKLNNNQQALLKMVQENVKDLVTIAETVDCVIEDVNTIAGHINKKGRK
jgi:archaellum component FlaC